MNEILQIFFIVYQYCVVIWGTISLGAYFFVSQRNRRRRRADEQRIIAKQRAISREVSAILGNRPKDGDISPLCHPSNLGYVDCSANSILQIKSVLLPSYYSKNICLTNRNLVDC